MTLTLIVAITIVTALCTYAWMKAARITDDQDEREARQLEMSMHAFRFPRKEDV